jgi:hypothetical protein
MSLKVTQNETQAQGKPNDEDFCPHCGQLNAFGGYCNCDGAQRAARIAQSRTSAHGQVRDLFLNGRKFGFEADASQEVISLLYSAVDAVADSLIVKVAVNLSPFSQAVICTDSKGLIKVQRKDVKDVALTEQA